ncbi:hypothetical protein [Glaciimonas soli]|uniref:Pentapeptide MXKDX repeat protein n=1 Tax=Glaciimonas soli TaxID=2590999 RepID=A0A843YTZ4_9BURK|nr:hypothetical protein [Glaciimonas soli]MQR01477.1 hypothetical protein [Glaciimonas soli]
MNKFTFAVITAAIAFSSAGASAADTMTQGTMAQPNSMQMTGDMQKKDGAMMMKKGSEMKMDKDMSMNKMDKDMDKKMAKPMHKKPLLSPTPINRGA